MDSILENIITNANSIQESEDDTEEITDLAGFQVTKAELFSHTREPAVTIWENRIKFNMACLRKYSNSNSSRTEKTDHTPLQRRCARFAAVGAGRR